MAECALHHAGIRRVLRGKIQCMFDNLGLVLGVIAVMTDKIVQKGRNKRIAGSHGIYNMLFPMGCLGIEPVAVIAGRAFTAAGANADFRSQSMRFDQLQESRTK